MNLVLSGLISASSPLYHHYLHLQGTKKQPTKTVFYFNGDTQLHPCHNARFLRSTSLDMRISSLLCWNRLAKNSDACDVSPHPEGARPLGTRVILQHISKHHVAFQYSNFCISEEEGPRSPERRVTPEATQGVAYTCRGYSSDAFKEIQRRGWKSSV